MEIWFFPVFIFLFHCMLMLTASMIILVHMYMLQQPELGAFLKSFELISLMFTYWGMKIPQNSVAYGSIISYIIYASLGLLGWPYTMHFSFFLQQHKACYSHFDDRRAREQVYFKWMQTEFFTPKYACLVYW